MVSLVFEALQALPGLLLVPDRRIEPEAYRQERTESRMCCGCLWYPSLKKPFNSTLLVRWWILLCISACPDRYIITGYNFKKSLDSLIERQIDKSYYLCLQSVIKY